MNTMFKLSLYQYLTMFGVCALCKADNRITITNQCAEPIFVTGRPNVRVPNTVLQPGGGRVVAEVASSWSGILWAKTGCSLQGSMCESDAPSPGSPVTQAEFTFNAGGNNHFDSYDVSHVDGSNLPMSIRPTGQLNPPPNSGNTCGTAICKPDLRNNCPAQLRFSPRGRVAGCKNDRSDVARNFFLQQCPEAYAFEKDDRNTFTCRAANPGNAEYNITLCP